MKFKVTETSCHNGHPHHGPPAVYEATADFEDLYLPGGIPAFERAPYDEDSQHMFADHYFLLPAGCYDVKVTPLGRHGRPSHDCYSAHQDGVRVNDGETTEIVLISQCQGPPRGGLDVVASINHPPVIENVEFEPSKFVASCWGVEVCVTASDPDGDPLEFVWKQTGGGPVNDGPNVTSTNVNPDGSVTQCGMIQTGAIDSYEFKVTAYDLAYDDQGQIARIEDLLSAQGDPHPSRDSIKFPIHAGIDCPLTGRTVTMMVALSNNPGPSPLQARLMARNAINWVNPTLDPDPTILLVLDDATNGEHPGELLYLENTIAAAGFGNVATKPESPGGLDPADIAGADIVWFSNPGFPMNDVKTYNTLMSFRNNGGGLILQGDDMGWFAGNALPMTPFTNLIFNNNGTTTCGVVTNNNAGANYLVEFGGAAGHPLLLDLDGESFLYGNDIDHTTAINLDEVFATARLAPAPGCPVRTPVLVGIDP